jgi:hypothetical protein
MNKYWSLTIMTVLVIVTFVLTAVLFPRSTVYVKEVDMGQLQAANAVITKYEETITQYEKSIKLQCETIDRLRATPLAPSGAAAKNANGSGIVNSLKGYVLASIGDSGSMLPTMNENSQVLLSKEEVSIGDIIVFKNGDSRWVHRIIGDNGDCWLVQGDANRYTNQIEYVPKTLDIWRVMAIIY